MLSMIPVRRLRGEDRCGKDHIIETEAKNIPSLLKTAAIYGANASGKTNLLLGLSKMQGYVFDSLRELRSRRKAICDPFAFSAETLKNPTLYEIQFLAGGYLYRYGFETGRLEVESEWLYRDEEELFQRQHTELSVGASFKEGIGKEHQVRRDSLFLTVCGSYNGRIASEILSQFRKIKVNGSEGRRMFFSEHPANRYLRDSDISDRLLRLIQLADPGLVGFRQGIETITKRQVAQRSGEPASIESQREVFEAVYNGKAVDNTLQLDELSAGTVKLLYTAGDILRAIDSDGIVVIDEIDIQLHPLLIEALLNMFHSQTESKAQLIFTTHCTYPLRKKLLRRDQVWFVDKQLDLSSQLINFSEYRVRPDASYEKDYLNGRFGGVPSLELVEVFGDE